MRIFVSFAGSRRADAARAALRLIRDGHRVFHDRSSLREGGEYDTRIRAEIRRADLVVFLVDADFLRPKSYTLTELGLAERRWRHPEGHAIPVLIDGLDAKKLPPWLGAVNAVSVQGDMAAEVAAAIETMVFRRRRRVLALAAVGAGGLAVFAARFAGRDPDPAAVAIASDDVAQSRALAKHADGGVATLVAAGQTIALHPHVRKSARKFGSTAEIRQQSAPTASESRRPAEGEKLVEAGRLVVLEDRPRGPGEIGRMLVFKSPATPLPKGGILNLKRTRAVRCLPDAALADSTYIHCSIVAPDRVEARSLIGEEFEWSKVQEAQ